MGKRGALLDQCELNVVNRDDFVGDRIELFKDLYRPFRIAAIDDEFFAAAEDGDVQCGGNLAQVFIHRAAQMRQAPVIEWLGREVVRLGRGFGFQSGLFNMRIQKKVDNRFCK